MITGVGTLIHIYSIGYMSHDESPGKFFWYLNLFCFAMLMLVLGSFASNFVFGVGRRRTLQLFAHWILV